MQLVQMGTMMRYEFRMHWRRRMLFAFVSTLIMLNLIMILIARDSLVNGMNLLRTYSDHPDIVPLFWTGLYFVTVAFLGALTCDSIAIDRQIGVRELLDTLPLQTRIYLIGKVAGVIAGVVSCLLIAMMVIGVGAYLILGAYDLGKFIEMWLIGALPIALMNPTLSLLLAAGQSTRRRAAIIGGLFAFVCIWSLGSNLNPYDGFSTNLLVGLNPARPAILRYFFVSEMPMALSTDVAWAIIIGVMEVLVVGVIVWAWMRWREQLA